MSGDQWGAGSVVTSEAVVLDFNIAGLGSRSIARSIDFTIQLVLFFCVAMAAGIGSLAGGAAGIVILLFGGFLSLFGYPVLLETLNNGRTVGKMATGTRVVTIEGAPVRFRHALLRALLSIFDIYLPLGGIAVVAALSTQRGQRVGDLAAGTMVVRDRTAARDVAALWFPPPAGLEEFTRTIDAGALTPRTYQALRSFLARAYEMHEPGRSKMAADLVALVRLEVRSPPPPPNTSNSLYLAAVAAAAQGNTQPGASVGRPIAQQAAPPSASTQPARFIPTPGSPSAPLSTLSPPSDTPSAPPSYAPPPNTAPPSTTPPNTAPSSGGFAAPG